MSKPIESPRIVRVFPCSKFKLQWKRLNGFDYKLVRHKYFLGGFSSFFVSTWRYWAEFEEITENKWMSFSTIVNFNYMFF